jgi:electron transport complex protein RnfC
MMGRTFADLDAPLTKGMGGIVIYPEGESKRGLLTNCIRCGRCVTVCPLGLEPYLVAALVDKGNLERAEEERLLSCCDCACCGYTCPANRPLVDLIKMGKARIMELMKTRPKT